MRDLDPLLEQEFFGIFRDYFDLEQNTSRKYSSDEYTLDRMLPLARLAGNPEKKLRLVHVAGTKGKGSTCYLLTALLRSANVRCGAFTSPHLATVRERFQMDCRLVPYAKLIKHAREYESKLRRNALQPTLFEIMTVLSMQIFAAENCEFAILETGIGGLLDSTNYPRQPECCVITAVSLDHTQLLGNTIAEIAAQKAGIIKAGVPVVCGTQPYPEAERVVRQTAARLDAPVFEPAPAAELDGWASESWPPFLADNFRAALQACRVLRVTPEREAFRLPELRARCECIRRDPLVVIDGAHNADSALKLVDGLLRLYPGRAFTVVLGVTKGKDAEGIFTALSRLGCDFILTHPRSHKGSELDVLTELAQDAGARFTVRPEIDSLDDLPPGRNLVFTGSFFTALIGEALFSREADSAA